MPGEEKGLGIQLIVVPLTTKIVRGGKELEVCAVTAKIQTWAGEVQYHTLLMTPAEVNQLPVFTEPKDFVNYSSIGSMTLVDKEATERRPGHIYLQRIDNYAKDIKYIGTALEEFAFRFSIEKGYEGQVKLSAAWSSHLFHYKNGYRTREEHFNTRLQAVADQAQQTGARVETDSLGSMEMYLPDEAIELKRKKLGVSKWDIHSAKARANSRTNEDDILIKAPDDIVNYHVLPLLGGDDIISLYQVSKQHKKLIEENLPTMPLAELLKLTAWIFKQGDNPLIDVCLKQLRAHDYSIYMPIVGEKRPIDFAIQYQSIPLLERLIRQGVKLQSAHLITSLKTNNLQMAKAILQRYDTTELRRDPFKELIEQTLKNNNDNKPLIQILYNILNNTAFMGRTYGGSELDIREFDHYKLLLACLLNDKEAVIRITDSKYNSENPIRNAYEFLEQNPNLTLMQSFINNVGENSWPAKLADNVFGEKELVIKPDYRSDDENNNDKYIYVPSKSAAGHDNSKLFYQNVDGKSQAVKYFPVKLQELMDKKERYSSLYVKPKDLFDLIPQHEMTMHSPISVYRYIYDKAEKSKDNSILFIIFEFEKNHGLKLPHRMIEGIASDATRTGDIALLKKSFEYINPENILREASRLFKWHGSESYIYGNKKITLTDDIIVWLRDKIEAFKPQALSYIDQLLAHLKNESHFPSKTSNFLGVKYDHKNFSDKQNLIRELTSIRNNMEADYPKSYPECITQIVSALRGFHSKVYDEKDKNNLYHKNLLTFLEIPSDSNKYLNSDDYTKPLNKQFNNPLLVENQIAIKPTQPKL